MPSRRRYLPAVALAVVALACSKPDDPPMPTEPWPAPAFVEEPTTSVAHYTIAEPSQLRVSVGTAAAELVGRITVLEGNLQIDLLDVRGTRGTIRADVASISMTANEDGEDDRQRSTTARNWLDLGSNKPEATREKQRWAEFVISQVEPEGPSAAHEGKRLRRTADPLQIDPPASPETDDAAPTEPPVRPEVRELRVRARGALTLHGYRVEHTVRLRARFHYPGPAARGDRPARIEIESRGPLVVSLAAHDIKPRDASGTFVTSEVKLLGSQISRDARIAIGLVAVPTP